MKIDERNIEVIDDEMAEVLREKTPQQRLAIAFGMWPLIMGREKGITLPDVIPQDKEYYSFGIPISLSDLKKLACSIDDTYRKGGYS